MSIAFNGTSSKLAWSGVAVSAFPVTLFCWIKPASASADYMAFGVGDSGGADELDIFVGGTGTNKVRAFSNAGGSLSAHSTTGVQTTWQPAMAVFTSASSRTIYYASGAAVTYTEDNEPNFAVFDRLVVGCRAITDSLFFSGEIAECAIWSSALTQANFNTLAAGGTPESVSSGTLVDAWSLESASALTGVNGRSLTATSATNGSTHPITRSGGSTDATADGATLTGTATLTPGTATGWSGAVDATADGVTLTGAATLTPGTATGGASGSFTSSPMYSSGILQASVALDWTWYPGAIGAAPTAALVHGSGATAGDGTLTAAGLSAGSGFLLAETVDGAVYYEAGTVV